MALDCAIIGNRRKLYVSKGVKYYPTNDHTARRSYAYKIFSFFFFILEQPNNILQVLPRRCVAGEDTFVH
eukprot:scaffold145966_cov20-Prasinocladus_malaysianus.AAC.1